MQKHVIIKRVAAVIIMLGVIAIALLVYYKFTGRGDYSQYGVNKSKDELMREYLKYAGMGEDFKAYRSLKAASNKDPENIPLLRKTATAAIKAGKKAEANKLLQKVWDSGYKDPKVLFTLISTSVLPKLEQRERTITLINEIKDQALRKKLYALYYFQMEKYEKAEEFFNWLIENDPNQVIYEYNARNLLELRRPKDAQQTLEQAEKAGYLGTGGEIILANLYAVDGELGKEKKLFENYITENGKSDYVLLSHAIILIANNKMAEAKPILESISHPSRFSASNVSAPEEVIEKLKNDPSHERLLSRLSTRTKDILNKDEQNIFEISLFSEYLAQDFNRIAEEDSKDSEGFLIELSKLHDLFDSEMSPLGSNTIAHQARIFLAPILYMQKDEKGLKELLLYASGSDRFYEGERDYEHYFIAKLDGDKTAKKYLESATDILGRNAMTMITNAQEESDSGNYASAIMYYSLAAKQNKTIGSGSFLLEHLVKALADDEKYLASFELIRRMHNNRMISKNTLIMLRDVAYRAGFPEVSNGAQKVLEKKYGSSDDIMLGRAELKLKEGDAQAALKVFEKLLAKGIEPTYKARLNSVMAEAMLQLQMFGGVLDIVDDNNIDNSYKARALYGLGKHDEALEVFGELNDGEENTGQWRVEYGLLLALKGREGEASLQFKKAIDDNPKLIRAYVELASILLKHDQFEPAKMYATQALNLVPSLVRAKLVVANVDIVEGNNASAELMLNDILRVYPDNIDALFLLTRSLLNQGEGKKALDIIDKCLRIKPMYPLFLQQKIDILVALKRIKEAEAVASIGADAVKDNDSFEHARVALLLQLNEPEKAFKVLKQSKSIAGSDKLILESQVLVALGRSKEAIDKLLPYVTSAKVEFRVIELMIKHGDSADDYIKYIESNIDKFKFSAKLLLVLGIMAEDEGKYSIAQILYRKGLELAPDELHLLNNYIWASLQVENVDETKILKEVEKAKKLYPDDTMILDTCAEAYNKYKMYDKTIDLLRMDPVLLRLEPSLYLQLGDAWAGKKNISEAKAMYEKIKVSKRSTEKLIEAAKKRLNELN